MPEPTIALEEDPLEEDISEVTRGLVHFNDTQAASQNQRQLTLIVRDGGGRIQGGLIGYTHWGWLFVSRLWVDESLRGRGIGRELIRRAETEAIEGGCLHAHLDTFSFQARGFYEALGYEVFGSLSDYPPGHTRFFLQKRDLGSRSA